MCIMNMRTGKGFEKYNKKNILCKTFTIGKCFNRLELN